MKTFLISLERATERRNRMIQDLDALSLDYEIFDAVDGSKLTEQEIAQYCDLDFLEKNESWFPRGAIGACLSHYYVYQEIIKRDLKYAFIIEDDAKLTPEILSLVEKCKDLINSNEVILVYYQSDTKTSKISNQDKIKLDKHYYLHYPHEAKYLTAAGAYIITKEACEKLVNFLLPIRNEADDWQALYENCLNSIRLIYPRPMVTYDYRSTISNISETREGNLAKAIKFIDKHKIPVLNQLLRLRRKFNKTYKDGKFELTDEKSLILNKK